MATRTTTRRDSVNQSLIHKASEKQGKTEKEVSKTPKQTNKHAKTTDPEKTPETKSVEKPKQKDENSAVSKPTDFDSFREDIMAFFEKYDTKLDDKLNKFDQKFSKIFDELKKEINTMRIEVYETNKELGDMRTRIDDMEKTVEYQAQTCEEREDKQSVMLRRYTDQLKELQTKLLYQEKHDRRYNLLFYGFTEEPKEDLELKMKHFFTGKLEIPQENVDQMIIANVHRLPTEAAGPKPVIMKFVRMSDRDEVFSKAFHPILRDEKKRILSDLPVCMKKERGRLAKIAYNIRKSEEKQTRIVENGLTVQLEVRKDKTKPWQRRDTPINETEEEEVE